jgi:hypothetical protein
VSDLEFHHLAEKFPLMEGADFDALVEDVRKYGVREPITQFEGKILDGRNRYRAAEKAGVTLNDDNFVELSATIDPQAFVISANIHRRHLTAEQKRALIAELLKTNPGASDRQIAETAKADHKTVGVVRQGLERGGEIPHVDTRTDTKGRRQPGKKGNGKPKGSSLRTKKWYDVPRGSMALVDAIAKVSGTSRDSVVRDALDRGLDILRDEKLKPSQEIAFRQAGRAVAYSDGFDPNGAREVGSPIQLGSSSVLFFVQPCGAEFAGESRPIIQARTVAG